MLISLAEYAKKHGKDPSTVRQKALRGGFETAYKLGRNWVIDSEEQYGDERITNGNYINQRGKIKTAKMDKSIRSALKPYGQNLRYRNYGCNSTTGFKPKYGLIDSVYADLDEDNIVKYITIYVEDNTKEERHYFMEAGVVDITEPIAEFLSSSEDYICWDYLVSQIAATIDKYIEENQ